MTPYIHHPERIANNVRGWKRKCVAWLHDVIEDTPCTEDSLSKLGVDQDIIRCVMLLSKPKDPRVSYREYLARIKHDPIARDVKIADMQDNLSDDPTERQIKKYHDGIAFLRQ